MQQFLNMKDDELQAEVQKLIEEGNRRRLWLFWYNIINLIMQSQDLEDKTM
jgi:hypothetical protein